MEICGANFLQRERSFYRRKVKCGEELHLDNVNSAGTTGPWHLMVVRRETVLNLAGL
jgi:hypothetical protein